MQESPKRLKCSQKDSESSKKSKNSIFRKILRSEKSKKKVNSKDSLCELKKY